VITNTRFLAGFCPTFNSRCFLPCHRGAGIQHSYCKQSRTVSFWCFIPIISLRRFVYGPCKPWIYIGWRVIPFNLHPVKRFLFEAMPDSDAQQRCPTLCIHLVTSQQAIPAYWSPALDCLQSPNFWPYILDKSLSRFLIPSLASPCYHNLVQSPDIETPLNWHRVPACPDCSLSLTRSWTTIHPVSAGSTDLRNLYPMRILSPEQHLPILDGSQISPSFETEQQQGLRLTDWMTSY
jgi:hypothetical protein